MKIVAAADTHSFQEKIKFPDGDILILAGDVTLEGTEEELLRIRMWIDEQLNTEKFKHIITIAGNHDLPFVGQMQNARDLLNYDNIHYLEDSGITIDGVKFYGSPWTKSFGSWADAFIGHDKELDEHWSKIPENIDVLITHSPPYMILDKVYGGGHDGSLTLYLQVINRIKPKYHIFGHIHEASGREEYKGITFINASIINEDYKVTNEARVIEI